MCVCVLHCLCFMPQIKFSHLRPKIAKFESPKFCSADRMTSITRLHLSKGLFHNFQSSERHFGSQMQNGDLSQLET